MTSKFFHCFSYIDNILLSATIKSLYLFTIKKLKQNANEDLDRENEILEILCRQIAIREVHENRKEALDLNS